MEELKRSIKDWKDNDEIADCLERIASKQAGDGTGLIYGLGHAVYTISDPRAVMLRDKAFKLAAEKGRTDEFNLYHQVELRGPGVIKKLHPSAENVCANVDLYSGLVYDMLNIPKDLYTPLFAVGRVVGWCAHRMEELTNAGPIIRPAYKPIFKRHPYTRIADRS